jgi:tetratricopeptide (TPR) repeat protein
VSNASGESLSWRAIRSRPRRLRERAAVRATYIVTFLAGALCHPAFAADGNTNAATALAEISAVDREAASVDQAIAKARSEELTVEQRLANGELLYRAKDYARAAVVLSEIIEKYPNTPSHADALWLRGETYYESKEYLAARRDYRAIVDNSQDRYFQPHAARSLARMVDVALRTNDAASLDAIFPKLSLLQGDPVVQYAKGKALYARKDYDGAQQAFSAIPNGAIYTHQARYFQALVAMKLARAQVTDVARAQSSSGTTAPASTNYKVAIERFRVAAELTPDTPDHRHVIDLSWMAIGRLFYEMEQYQQASEAYGKVARESPEFDTMLYELAWVYVRLGDVQRAERALEVLSISNPNSQYLADGTLLRADLLLRAGSFDTALKLYENVREQYAPMRDNVESFISSTKDITVYYDRLSQRELDVLDQSGALPPLALKWAREAEDGQLAFALVDDVALCKTLIKKSNGLVERLNAVIGASNRVRLFPEIMAGEMRAVGLLNRISRARLEVARGLDATEPEQMSGEIATVRARRQKLMAGIATLPSTTSDFDAREQEGMRRWDIVSQRLSEQTLSIDQLQAVVNGLRRWMRDEAARGVARDSGTLDRFTKELEENERNLKAFREQSTDLRTQVDFSRLQVGFGDSRYQDDAARRPEFRDVIEREVELASANQAGSDAQQLASRVRPALAQARTLEDRLAAAFFALDAKVAARTSELKSKVDEEATKIASYTVQLEGLDHEARDTVGRVAERNFLLVREKLRGIVLRADVGITEQAWEVREEEMDRVRSLQTERAREEQVLDEEMREVLDDAGEGAPSGGQQGAK